MKTIVCPLCKNSKSRIGYTTFLNEVKSSNDENDICLICENIGFIEPLFFIEFAFDEIQLDNSYWLPLIVCTDDMKFAQKRRDELLIALGEKYKNVESSNPLPYHQMSHFRLDQVSGYKKAKSIKKLVDRKNIKSENNISHSMLYGESIIAPYFNTKPSSKYLYTNKQFPVKVINEVRDIFDLEGVLVLVISHK